MGTGASTRLQQQPPAPEVHVVVVQSNEDGNITAEHVRPSAQQQGSSSESRATAESSSTVNRHRMRPAQLHSTSLHSRYHQPVTAAAAANVDQQQQQTGYYQQQQQRVMAAHNRRRSSSTEQSSSVASSPNGNPEFKIFRTRDNEEYTVHIADDGKMYYVDWDYQKWRVFPAEWCNRGSFESSEGAQNQVEREGELIHPFRGKLITLLRQESMNVMYFFDENFNGWLPMPLTWERHTPLVSRLLSEVRNTCPEWTDEKSIVAALRQCNYKVEDTISYYLSINDEGIFDRFKDGSNDTAGNVAMINKLQQQIKDLENQLKHFEENKKAMEETMTQLKDNLNEVKLENNRLKKELDSTRTEQQRQSAVLQQSLGRGSLRMPALTLKLNILRPVIQAASQETRAIKLKLLSTRQQVKKSVKSHSEQMIKLSDAVTLLVRQYRQQANDLLEVRALYRKEALQRKLLFNEVQELKGNIRVFCRCRHDPQTLSGSSVMRFENEDTIHITPPAHRAHRMYEFEKVYRPETSQEEVFEDTRPIITSCVDGYNVCIIAYGQTGSGKTYTMMGPKDNPGVNIRSIKELFSILNAKEKTSFEMKVSMVEVYNESIYDLLTPPHEIREKLQLQKKGKDIHVPGLTEIEICSIDDVVKVMSLGEKNRTTASTKMNTNSSRSHLLLLLSVKSYNYVSKTTTKGTLTLVDLAGSERISRSEATGLRLVEAAAINKSLSALGQVFASIRENSLHIPFRNSKLTHLLQQCLGGDAKACMFVNVSPLEANLPETVSTLDFGANARQVALGKATSHVSKAAQ